MEIRRKVINGNRWELVNEYWETSRAWGHKTTIIRNGYDYEASKIRYYNRTWEAYTYQTSMYRAVSKIFRREVDCYIRNYKRKNNIDKFKYGERLKVIREFKETELGKELIELREIIRDRRFD